MRLNNAMRLEGRFRIEVDHVDTGNVTVLDWQDNAVLTQILSSNVNKATTFLYLRFGTGTATPTVNDTSLANPITQYIGAAISGSNSGVHRIEGSRVGEVHTKKCIWKFAGSQGGIQGNITELGLATIHNNMAQLFTRALIKDESNNPTVLVLGANDILTVYYEVSNITDCSIDVIASKNFSFNGSTVTAKLRLINQDAANNTASDLSYRSLLSVGVSANDISVNLMSLLLPAHNYITAANGTISNTRNITIGTLTSLINRNINPTQSNLAGYGVAYDINTGASYKEFASGVGSGTWKYLFFNSFPTNPVTSQNEMNRCNLMIEFDPPLVKAAADKFTFDTLRLIGGGAPL